MLIGWARIKKTIPIFDKQAWTDQTVTLPYLSLNSEQDNII